MVTLILIATFLSASCAAAAGLIASAQNGTEAARALTGLTLDQSEPRT